MVPAALGLASIDNLITLCPNCHAAYDIELPYWVMVPHINILNTYIRHERRECRQRIAAAARGDTVPRTLPVIDKQNALYYQFIMAPKWASATATLLPDTKRWAGEPTAVILKCVAGLGQPCEQINTINVAGMVVRVGLIEDVRSKVNELIRKEARTRVGGQQEGEVEAGAINFQRGQEGRGREGMTWVDWPQSGYCLRGGGE